MTWRVNVQRVAAKQLEGIPPDRRERILKDIRELGGDPFRGLVKPLKGGNSKGFIARFQEGTGLLSNRCLHRAR